MNKRFSILNNKKRIIVFTVIVVLLIISFSISWVILGKGNIENVQMTFQEFEYCEKIANEIISSDEKDSYVIKDVLSKYNDIDIQRFNNGTCIEVRIQGKYGCFKVNRIANEIIGYRSSITDYRLKLFKGTICIWIIMLIFGALLNCVIIYYLPLNKKNTDFKK